MRKYNLIYTVVLLLWLKTYIVQRFYLDLPVKGWNQEFIMLINPLSSVLVVICILLLAVRKYHSFLSVVLSVVSSFLLFADLIYYRFFNDFITIPVLLQGDNMGDLWGSVFTLVQPRDAFIFADCVLLIGLLYFRKLKFSPLSSFKKVTAFGLAAIIFVVNLSMAEQARPELLSRTFDRQIVVKSLGTYNYHVYDAIISAKMGSKKVFASDDDYNTVKELVSDDSKPDADPQMFGAAKGRNVFLISMESLQGFALERSIDGQEITPFLNDLLKDSFYFENFYHQTGQGRTSDAEFLIDTSLYPLPSGAVFFTHSQNTYETTPKTLKENGYYPAAFHANDRSYWNRGNMYPSLGYERYFSVEDYVVNEEDKIGWGLNDISFFKQTVEKAKTLPQPFYAKLITLTNHYPFELPEEDRMIPEYTSKSRTLNRYVTTVRYLDEALKSFFDEVKKQGLYENSIFVLYGDHYGISEKHNKSMAQLLGIPKITPYDHAQLQKVPLIIHIPGMKGKRMDTVSGQIDVKPTLLNLLGIEHKDSLEFGRDLFAKNRPELVVFRDGGFVTNRYVYADNACYVRATGELADAAYCEPYQKEAADQLQFSDSIIYGDLLRFSIHEKKQLERRKL
ncbi:LTA synthase family protein [Paenibacillus thermotolerans]|uniref:LTA synthase family protein n=1 Tax=Paenibacillus thermotolerans TaxID=3027807 RepID=UPI002368DEB1|nr:MULTISPECIES: LTA synthase family protein [unclassified Paenibacillus]